MSQIHLLLPLITTVTSLIQTCLFSPGPLHQPYLVPLDPFLPPPPVPSVLHTVAGAIFSKYKCDYVMSPIPIHLKTLKWIFTAFNIRIKIFVIFRKALPCSQSQCSAHQPAAGSQLARPQGFFLFLRHTMLSLPSGCPCLQLSSLYLLCITLLHAWPPNHVPSFRYTCSQHHTPFSHSL